MDRQARNIGDSFCYDSVCQLTYVRHKPVEDEAVLSDR